VQLFPQLFEYAILLADSDGKVSIHISLPIAASHPCDVQELVAVLVLVDTQWQMGVVGVPVWSGRSAVKARVDLQASQARDDDAAGLELGACL
jgi:hypothetical protein